MSRITITEHHEHGETTVLGWFDPAKCDRLEQNSRWDGSNFIGVMNGIEVNFATCVLYRTPGGRWVERDDRRHYYDGSDMCRFLDDDQAQDWILQNAAGEHKESEQWLAKYFPGDSAEAGPGQPRIGTKVTAVLTDTQIAALDALVVDGTAKTRSEALRIILDHALRQYHNHSRATRLAGQ